MRSRRRGRALRRRYGHAARPAGALTRYWLVADVPGPEGHIRSWHVKPDWKDPVSAPAFDSARKHKAHTGEPVTIYGMYEYAEEIAKV